MQNIEAIAYDENDWRQEDITELRSILSRLAGPESVDLTQSAYAVLLLRAIEMAIISHPAMISMIRTPNVYLGTEAAEVRKIFSSYGLDLVPDAVVDFFVKIVQGRVALQTSKQTISPALFGRVAVNQFTPGSEMRCAICGYHFREDDMSGDRLDQIKDLNLELSSITPPERFRDIWKPASEKYRRVTVDHILPEASLGPPHVENLRVVCGFCNHRRQISRRHLESFGNRVSSSLLAITGGERGGWAMESAVYFAVCEVRRCTDCGIDSSSAELTAVPINGDYKWTGMLPWQLAVFCYAHSGL